MITYVCQCFAQTVLFLLRCGAKRLVLIFIYFFIHPVNGHFYIYCVDHIKLHDFFYWNGHYSDFALLVIILKLHSLCRGWNFETTFVHLARITVIILVNYYINGYVALLLVSIVSVSVCNFFDTWKMFSTFAFKFIFIVPFLDFFDWALMGQQSFVRCIYRK